MIDSKSARVETAANFAEMTRRLSVSTIPATWPGGVSQLAQAIFACQHCDGAVVCTDWLARAPARLTQPPAFCPNSEMLVQAKRPKDEV